MIVDAARNKIDFDHATDRKENEQITNPENPMKVGKVKSFGQKISAKVASDFVEKVNRGLKLFLFGLLSFFVFVYSVIAAGYY